MTESECILRSVMITRLAVVAAAVLTLTACASTPNADGPNRSRAWLSANAAGIRQMRGAAANLEVVMDATDPRAPYCAKLAADVAQVEAGLPSPDKTLTRLVHAAAEHYGQGGVDALNALPGAAGLLARGDREIRQAVDRSEHLGQGIY